MQIDSSQWSSSKYRRINNGDWFWIYSFNGKDANSRIGPILFI